MNHLRVLSGIQPTGGLHLGNYLGAIRHWVAMQDTHECLYCIVDLHAITLSQSPDTLRRHTLEMAAALMACGIDPKRSMLFPQSAVFGHAELAWVLGCHTPLGWLNRMTQFKEKAGKQRDMAVLGLYSYPVLQAADILLYKATHVPVGEDQKQHLELARDIAGAFNRACGEEFFPLPEPLILGETTRVMSLRDGRAKMSKSDPSEYSRIHLDDDADTIALKIRKAKSDMIEGMSISEDRPEAANLLGIYAAITGRTLRQAQEECQAMNFSSFKALLTEALVAHLTPIREKLLAIREDTASLHAILNEGIERAQAIARPHLKEVYRLTGFYA